MFLIVFLIKEGVEKERSSELTEDLIKLLHKPDKRKKRKEIEKEKVGKETTEKEDKFKDGQRLEILVDRVVEVTRVKNKITDYFEVNVFNVNTEGPQSVRNVNTETINNPLTLKSISLSSILRSAKWALEKHIINNRKSQPHSLKELAYISLLNENFKK